MYFLLQNAFCLVELYEISCNYILAHLINNICVAIQVGGVMVAPVNDELVQLYKESPYRDICCSLLDVSFSTLVKTSNEPGSNCDPTVELRKYV